MQKNFTLSVLNIIQPLFLLANKIIRMNLSKSITEIYLKFFLNQKLIIIKWFLGEIIWLEVGNCGTINMVLCKVVK